MPQAKEVNNRNVDSLNDLLKGVNSHLSYTTKTFYLPFQQVGFHRAVSKKIWSQTLAQVTGN